MQPKRPNHGFTLIEVLTALAVLAIALTAAFTATGRSIDLSFELRDRSIALWVAQERAAMHQLSHDWPSIDTTEGVMEMVNRNWRWRERVTQTPVADLRRIDIEVLSADKPDVLISLPVFLQKKS